MSEANEPDRGRAPIWRHSGFPLHSIEAAATAFEAERAFPQSGEPVYTRWSNPTVLCAEEAVARVEGSRWSALASSGMAAIDLALSIHQDAGDDRPLLIFSEVYGGTIRYAEAVLVRRRGAQVHWFRPQGEAFDIHEFERTLDDLRPKAVFFEPLTNPLLICVPARAVIAAAGRRGVATIIDNTMATPCLWRPLDEGADLVVQSATKYLSGHGNLTGGVVAGNDPELRRAVLEHRKHVGCILSPDDAYRLQTQLETLPLRFAAQCVNASRIAARLAAHPAVKRVRYPGLPMHPTHGEAVNLFGNRGFGAIVTFDLRAGRSGCDRFVAAVGERIGYVATFGDGASILTHVATTFGPQFDEGSIRLSVGFEDGDSLLATIATALDSIPA